MLSTLLFKFFTVSASMDALTVKKLKSSVDNNLLFSSVCSHKFVETIKNENESSNKNKTVQNPHGIHNGFSEYGRGP